MKLKQNVLYLSNRQARCLYIIILSQSISLNQRHRLFQDWDPGKRSQVTLHETSSKTAMPDLVSYEKAPEKQHPGSIFPISCKHIWRTQHFEQSVVPKNSNTSHKTPCPTWTLGRDVGDLGTCVGPCASSLQKKGDAESRDFPFSTYKLMMFLNVSVFIFC